MLFLRRTLKDDFLFPVSQVLERHVRAHAHFAADIDHERPHERTPNDDCAFFNGEVLVRNQCTAIHGTNDAGAAASGAGARTVKGEVFG